MPEEKTKVPVVEETNKPKAEQEEKKEKTPIEEYNVKFLEDLETLAKGQEFATKEEFHSYMRGLIKMGIPETVLTEEKIKELLDIYDKNHEAPGLDTSNIIEVHLGEQTHYTQLGSNVAVEAKGPKNEEFANVQNTLTAASTKDSLANADEVYDHMKDNIKETTEYIPINEVLNMPVISQEILAKVTFFLKNAKAAGIDPETFKISPKDGTLLNSETGEMIEVEQNKETGEYEMRQGTEVVATEEKPKEEHKEMTSPEETEQRQGIRPIEQPPETTIAKSENKGMVRKLVPPKQKTGLDNAAFAKISILATICMLTAVLLSYLILALK